MTQTLSGLSKKIADFIVRVEFDRQSDVLSSACENKQLLQFNEKNKEIDKQIQSLESEITHYKAIMTRAGTAQWHRETEKLLQQTKSEVMSLEEIYQQTCNTIRQESERLSHSSTSTIKSISRLLSSAKHNDLWKLSEEKSLQLQQECEAHIQNVSRSATRYKWKNFGLVLILSLAVAIIVSLYINDEWPWQAHAQVIKQRLAGEVLINSWKHLSEADKSLILQNA